MHKNDDLTPLFQRVARGDSAAIALSVNQLGPAVWSLALQLSPTRADAQAATQEIFLDTWRDAPRLSATRGNPASSVLALARRALLDRTRGSAAVTRRLDQAPGDLLPGARRSGPPPGTAAGAATAAGDPPAVAQQLPLPPDLPEVQRSLLELVVMHGMSQAQVAARLDLTRTQVLRGAIGVLLSLRGRTAPAPAFADPQAAGLSALAYRGGEAAGAGAQSVDDLLELLVVRALDGATAVDAPDLARRLQAHPQVPADVFDSVLGALSLQAVGTGVPMPAELRHAVVTQGRALLAQRQPPARFTAPARVAAARSHRAGRPSWWLVAAAAIGFALLFAVAAWWAGPSLPSAPGEGAITGE